VSALPKQSMTSDEFLDWTRRQPKEAGRFELIDGTVIRHQDERALHWEIKLALAIAFRATIARAGLPCYAAADGPTLRPDQSKVYRPDGLVYCGERAPAHALTVDAPVIVWEILSADSVERDHGEKVEGYFAIPTIQHYLIVDPERRAIIHHRRGRDDELITRIRRSGNLRLDPPGLEIAVADAFEREP
jgi:Uma2 family endonuclease